MQPRKLEGFFILKSSGRDPLQNRSKVLESLKRIHGGSGVRKLAKANKREGGRGVLTFLQNNF
jgi:hypothetical protein